MGGRSELPLLWSLLLELVCQCHTHVHLKCNRRKCLWSFLPNDLLRQNPVMKMWHYHLVNAHPLEELFFEWKYQRPSLICFMGKSLFYGHLQWKVPNPTVFQVAAVQSWSQPSITPQWLLGHVQRWQKLTKPFAKHCYQHCLFLKKKTQTDFFNGISQDSLKSQAHHCEQEPRAHVTTPRCPNKASLHCSAAPSEGDTLPEATSTSQGAWGNPCLPAWHKQPLGRDPRAHMDQDLGELMASHTAGRAAAHFSPREQGLAPEFNRRGQELGSAGKLWPHQTLHKHHLFPSTGSKHVQGSPPTNTKVIVTSPGQYCTALQSLTFPVGMRDPLLCLCPTEHERSRHPPPGSVVDALM